MNFKKILFFVTFVLPSALFTSDHPGKKRKVEGTVKLTERTYQKGDNLNFSGKPIFKNSDGTRAFLDCHDNPVFEVLVDGKAVLGFVYVKHIQNKQIGLCSTETGYFETGYTYETAAELVNFLKRKKSF